MQIPGLSTCARLRLSMLLALTLPVCAAHAETAQYRAGDRLEAGIALADSAASAVHPTNASNAPNEPQEGSRTAVSVMLFDPTTNAAGVPAVTNPDAAGHSIANDGIEPLQDSAAIMPVPAFGTALAATTLDEERGGTDLGSPVPLGGIVSAGVVTDNRAVDVVTGSNAIRDGSFANASGIPVVVQNTGANVLIQNATIVNIQLR